MEMTKLFLDDVRIPTDCLTYMQHRIGKKSEIYEELWEIVRNYDEFIDFISKNGVPDIVSFDHDLADEHYSPDMYSGQETYNKLYKEFKEKTGNDCAKWLCQYCLENGIPLPFCIVHSMNPVGTKNIYDTIKSVERFLEKLS
jgi:hypothetical protein